MTKWVFSTVLFLLTAGALAGVTSKGDSDFTLVITGEVMTTPVEAYDQFIRIEEWRLEGHTWDGKGENLSIEPKAGGLTDLADIIDSVQISQLNALVEKLSSGDH